MEYVIRDGERERNGSREIRVFVVSETWDVNVISDTGSDFLLPEASLSLTADVIRNCYDVDEGEEYQGDIASIEYDWKIADDNGNNFITISKGERENEITVAAKSLTGESAEAGYAQEIVQLDILIDGKVVATFDYPVTIANEYYKINAKEINSGMEIGASDTIEPSLELYQLGKEPETVTEDIRYRWKWDTDAVDIVDGDSKPLTEDDSIGAPPFTITRKGDWGTDLFLYAEMWNGENEEWEDVASCYYWLEDLDYSIWIDWDKIGGRDYIYTDEPEVTIPFNTENINDKTCDVNWYVTVDGEEENNDPIHNLIEEGRAFVSEDGNGIIIDGTGLLDGEAPLEVGQSIRVSAKVLVGDEVICESDEIWLEVCEPWEEYDISSDIYMLPKWDKWVSKTIGYHVNNGENPYGMDDEVQITKLTLITPNADEPSGEPVVEINDEDENGWNIHALTYGHAIIEAEYELYGKDGETDTKDINVWVNNDVWYLDIEPDTNTHEMLSEASMKLTAVIDRQCYDEENEHFQGDVSGVTYKWSIDYGEDAIALSGTEGEEITVTANPETDGRNVGITVTAFLGEEEVQSCFFDLYIRDTYYTLECDGVYKEPGTKVNVDDLNPKVIRYFIDEKGVHQTEEMEGYTFTADWNGHWTDVEFDLIEKVINDKEIELAKLEDDQFGTLWFEVYAEKDDTEVGAVGQITVCHHKWQENKKAPTCTEDGEIVRICEKCGYEERESIPATGHKWDEGTITTPATETSEGVKTYTCTVCGETRTESIPKLPVTQDKKPADSTAPTVPVAPVAPTTPAAPAAPTTGSVVEDQKSSDIYEVTGSSTVEYVKAKAAKAAVVVPASVTIDGKKYAVTSIAANAFRNNKKLKKVVIPAKITKIGKNAFLKCKNLKRVVIKSKKLKAKAIGKNAFKNISPKAVVKVPKGKVKAYQKILRAKGLGKKVRVK
ncbi:MAG: leucine-rich repeat protein [Eubacteriales bacterium]|nr:leucine-rich repeat protein [Eubacteriales bacterium]